MILDLIGEPMDIDDDPLNARFDQWVDHPVHQTLATNLYQGLRTCVRQRPHPGTEPGGQHHRRMRNI